MGDPKEKIEKLNADHLAIKEALIEHLPTYVEVGKIFVSCLDKLVVLDAGALALSVSAASIFRSKVPIGDGGIGFLFAAWKCLLSSIAVAIIAQFAYAQHLSASQSFLVQDIFRLKLEERLRAYGLEEDEELKKAGGDQRKRIIRVVLTSDFFEWVARLTGPVALAATIYGLYWFYRFAHINLI